MDLRRHYFEYTLSIPHLQAIVGIFCFVYTATGIFAVTTLQHDKRKMAWVISLLNSFVLTFSAGSYFLMHIPSFIKDGRSAFHTVNDVSALIAIWLCLANIYDLLFGLIFYRKYLDPLTAYVHHTLYVWITLVSVFGTDGIYQYEPFAGGLAALLVEELPTLLLALGSVFPSMRTDLGFGVTFLMFRVLFHAAMMTYSVYSGVSTLVTVLYSITMTMHLFWFVSWARKYGVKAVKKDKTVSAADDKKSS